MKKFFVLLPVCAALFAVCSNPLLKWIDTDDTGSSGGGGSAVSSSEKEIKVFSFGIPGETDETRVDSPVPNGKTPITVVLPAGTNKTNLSPAITIIGKSVSPSSGTAQNFNSPVTYLVTAQDNSWREYEVEVIVKTPESAEIIWFDLELPESGANIMAEGSVTEGSGDDPGNIVIDVPYGTNLANLTAKIVQTGKSLVAPNAINTQAFSRTAVTLTGNFAHFSTGYPSDNRIYTVESEDGLTSRKYVVTVVMGKSDVKAITAFSFAELETSEIDVDIRTDPQPDGKIPIIVTVPPGTAIDPLTDPLTPTITFTGFSITPPGGTAFYTESPYTDAPREFGDPLHPLDYRVTAEDSSYQDYTVRVFVSDRNSTAQITGFYFFPNTQGAEGVSGIINETAKTIVVTVPPGTNLSALAPTVYHTGVSIDPKSGAPKNFSNSIAVPVPYTVIARDGTKQTYRVSVYTAKRTSKAITAFDFDEITGETADIGLTPGTDGKIPIVVTVPASASITSLKPVITHTGYSLASVTGSEVSSTGTGPGTVYASGSVSFANPRIYRVTAEDGSSQEYTVTVIKSVDSPAVTAASIDLFYFNNPMVMGKITQPTGDGKGTITAEVPWDTNLTTLVPTIHFTGSKIKQGSDEVTANPAQIGADFTHPKTYTVTALDDITTKAYQVTVEKAAKPPSDAKEIIAFGFFEIDTENPLNDVDITTIISTMPDTNGDYPIEVIIPPHTLSALITSEDNYLKSLGPVIVYRGASITGSEALDGVSGNEPGTKGAYTTNPQNFTSPRRYTVRAENDKLPPRDYVVTVRVDENAKKKITAFYFTEPMAVGVIDQAAHTITVKVPYGTSLSALTPTVYYNGFSLDPVSGATRNFSSPVIYNVKAWNNTVQPYTVRVLPGQNSAKDITAFSFPGAGVFETVIGGVPDANGNIPISVTVAPNTALSSLSPRITHTGKTISPGPGEIRDFRNPVLYTVTAEDGTTKDYAVSVHVSNNSSAIITGFVFNAVPLSDGFNYIQAVGSINQDAGTITVALPRTVNATEFSSLTPTITYIGEFITPPGVSTPPPENSPRRISPFTDSAQDFDPPVMYKVTAADGTEREYTVSVDFEKQNLGLTVEFKGITDPNLLEAGFAQSTGLLTLTVKDDDTTSQNTGYGPPYEWYLDGERFTASTTEKTLILHAKSLGIGQHQMVLFAYGTTDGLPYTNTVFFTVDE